MYFLPRLAEFGKLEIGNIYSHYDVPRTFRVESKKLGSMLAFWIDESDSHDSWYYVNLGDDEIERLENGFIQLKDVFLHKDVFKIDTPYIEDSETIYIKLHANEVDQDALPPCGFSIKRISENHFGIEEI